MLYCIELIKLIVGKNDFTRRQQEIKHPGTVFTYSFSIHCTPTNLSFHCLSQFEKWVEFHPLIIWMNTIVFEITHQRNQNSLSQISSMQFRPFRSLSGRPSIISPHHPYITFSSLFHYISLILIWQCFSKSTFREVLHSFRIINNQKNLLITKKQTKPTSKNGSPIGCPCPSHRRRILWHLDWGRRPIRLP